MADSGFLQAALELLGRPGNAVRGALIGGPEGFGQGLNGTRQFDPTELPGINQLPDEGPSLGPLHLTPRTVAGFGASTALDPLSYIGGGALDLGRGLLHPATAALEHGLGEGALDLSVRPFAGDLGMAGQPAGVVADKMGEGAQRLAAQSAARRGYAGDPMSDPIEQLLEHANGITPGHELVSSDGAPMRDLPAPGTPLSANIAPNAEATPVGRKDTAVLYDRLAQRQGDLGKAESQARDINSWLDATSSDNRNPNQGVQDQRGRTITGDNEARYREIMGRAGKTTNAYGPEGETWEDVVGVGRGTDPSSPDVVDKQVGREQMSGSPGNRVLDVNTYKGNPRDLTSGAPSTEVIKPDSGYDEPVSAGRGLAFAKLEDLDKQIQTLKQALSGDRGSRYGDPLEQRGYTKAAADYVGGKQVLDESNQWRAERGYKPATELSSKQSGRASQASKLESSRRDPSLQYFGRDNLGIEDTDNPAEYQRPAGSDNATDTRLDKNDTRHSGTPGVGSYASEKGGGARMGSAEYPRHVDERGRQIPADLVGREPGGSELDTTGVNLMGDARRLFGDPSDSALLKNHAIGGPQEGDRYVPRTSTGAARPEYAAQDTEMQAEGSNAHVAQQVQELEQLFQYLRAKADALHRPEDPPMHGAPSGQAPGQFNRFFGRMVQGG